MIEKRLPSDLTVREMEIMADHLEYFIELLEDVFIVPDNIKYSEEQIKRNMKLVHELINRLRDGDRKVFKDDDECDLL